jgi:hypothetical protein
MNKKIKSTVDNFKASLNQKEKRAFDEEYKELLLSEMILAAMEEDHVSVRRLAKLANVSPTIVQSMRSGIKKDFNMGSFFKVLNGLGFKVFIERNGQQIQLNSAHLRKN